MGSFDVDGIEITSSDPPAKWKLFKFLNKYYH